MIFDIKEGLETGRKFFQIIWVKRSFLEERFNYSYLKVDGKVPDDKEKLMMFVRVGSRSSINSRKSDVNRRSNEQEVGFDFKIVAFSSATVIG